MEYNKKRVYQIPVFNTGGGNGSPGDGALLASDLGDWLDLPEKSLDIFDEQILIQYKLDMMSYPTKAILFLVGQFGINPDFVGSELLLGILPLNTRPKNRINKNITVQGTECYLVIETNGNVKLSAVTGDLPVTNGETENFPYFINLDYNPDITDGVTFTANRSGNFTRNNCGSGYTGSVVAFAKSYTSSVSQQAAETIADANFTNDGQAWANNPVNGATCTALPSFSAQRSQSFTRNNCASGELGSSVPFVKNYTGSTQQAADDAAANDPDFATEGQAFANDPVNGATCTLIGGNYTAQRTQSFTRNNCEGGQIGSSVPFSKNYNSAVSQIDADNQAANDPDFVTEGQAFANDPANGATCTIAICEPPTNVTVEDLGAATRPTSKAVTIDINTALTGTGLWNARIMVSVYFAEGKVFVSGFSGYYSTNEPNPFADADFFVNGDLPPDLVANAPSSAVTVELERFIVGFDEVIATFTIYPDGSYRVLFANSSRQASNESYTEGYSHELTNTIDYNTGKVYMYDKNIGTQLMQLYRVSYIGTGLHIVSIGGDTMFNFDIKETYSSPVELMIKPDNNVRGSVSKICSIPPDYSDLSTPVNFNP